MTGIWPILSREDVITFQFSTWFSTFSSLSIKSTVIPLEDEFRSYLEADGVFVPTGSENLSVHRFALTLIIDSMFTLDRRGAL
jgi:hypothetical protein